MCAMSTPLTQLNLPELRQRRQDTLTLDLSFPLEDPKTLGDLSARLTVTLDPTGLKLSGHGEGLVEVPCNECLNPFGLPVAWEVEERFQFTRFSAPPPKEQELHNEDFFETLDEDGILDLADLFRQYLVMEVSGTHVCPTCASGLSDL